LSIDPLLISHISYNVREQYSLRLILKQTTLMNMQDETQAVPPVAPPEEPKKEEPAA